MVKTDDELRAHQLYEEILKNIVYKKVGNKTTFMDKLNTYCKKLFGIKYRGTYPSDKIPKLNDLSKYCILNLDKSDEPGSHWVALAKHGKDAYFYDSFGRTYNAIIPNLEFSGNGRIINTDDDAEQEVKETDCGARCIAWLLVFDKYGPKTAMLV